MVDIHKIKKEKGMRVPAIVYASDKLFEAIKEGKTLNQIRNVSTLPGIVKNSVLLSDAHQGYGFPIGGVAAFDLDEGIISPGGVGYDINCSVRLLKTNLTKKDLDSKKDEVSKGLTEKIPAGVGRGSPFQLSPRKLDEVLRRGAKYLIEEGYGVKEDYLFTEEEGCMAGAEPELVSPRAKKRGIGQLGTIGSGNHFLDVLVVEEIFDEEIAKTFGLKKNQIVVLIHCGSRGLGHQVASDYIKLMEEEYGTKDLPDRELVYAPINSKLGQDYLGAMAAAANFAFANKQMLTHFLREELKKHFEKVKVDVVYDVCHNIAKFEEYEIDGKKKKVCVHRKGATRSFGPGREEIPKKYLDTGQPVLIPGSMGTPSYVLSGTKKSEELTFGSSVHGAGRAMSRKKAVNEFEGEKVKSNLLNEEIIVNSKADKSVAQESPLVYKDVNEVVDTVERIGLNKKVAKLKPLIVIIG